MRAFVVLFSILHIALCSCPDGFELVRDGECRGQLLSITALKFNETANTAIDKCNEIGGKPPIIHNEEHEQYYAARSPGKDYDYLIIGLVCNVISKRWEWSDGTPMDYKKPDGGHNEALDKECSTGLVWWIEPSGHWSYGDYWMGTSQIHIYCTVQLEQPKGDGCDSPDGDDSEDGQCFEVMPLKLTWQDAQTACQKKGTSLASIHNSQEDDFVRRLAVSMGAVNGLYLGGATSGKDSQFGWADGSEWDYENFWPGYPIAGAGDCLAMDTFSSSGQWMNVDCKSKFAVACARASNPRPICNAGPWKEGETIYSPGYPYDSSVPCDYFLTVPPGRRVQVEVLSLEANTCCDSLVMEDNVLGGNIVANLTGEVAMKTYTTASSNLMRVSWQPNGGVNVRGMMMRYYSV